MIERQQSSTSRPYNFLLTLAADHVTGATGLTPTVALSKNGGSFGAAAGAVTEIGNGWYSLAGNATDRNTLGELLVHVSAATSDPFDGKLVIVPWDPFDANLALSYLDTTVSSRASAAALVTAASALAAVQADTDDIQTRLPAALVGGRIDASVGAMAADTLTASALATSAVTEVQTGLATAAAQTTIAAAIAAVQADTDDVQTRLPTALVGGRIDASVGAMVTDVLTAAALAASAVTEIQTGLATAAAQTSIAASLTSLLGASIALDTTAASGSTTTSIRTGATQATGYFDGMILAIVHSNGTVCRRITSYNSTNGAFTVLALPFTPTVGDRVVVLTTDDLTNLDAKSSTLATLSGQLLYGSEIDALWNTLCGFAAATVQASSTATGVKTLVPYPDHSLDGMICSVVQTATGVSASRRILAFIGGEFQVAALPFTPVAGDKLYLLRINLSELGNLDAAVSTRAVAGDLMGLADGAITSAKFAASAIDAAAIAPDAIAASELAATAASEIAAAVISALGSGLVINGPIDASLLDVAVSTRATGAKLDALHDTTFTAIGLATGTGTAAIQTDIVSDDGEFTGQVLLWEAAPGKVIARSISNHFNTGSGQLFLFDIGFHSPGIQSGDRIWIVARLPGFSLAALADSNMIGAAIDFTQGLVQRLAAGLVPMVGAVGTGSTATEIIDPNNFTTAADGHFVGMTLVVNLASDYSSQDWHARRIIDFVASTGTFTLDSALPAIPPDGIAIYITTTASSAAAASTDWTSDEKSQIRGALGVTGTQGALDGGALQDALAAAQSVDGKLTPVRAAAIDHLDADISTRAAPGALMGLANAAITAAKFAPDAVNASALANDAVLEIASAIVINGPIDASRIDAAISSRAAPGALMGLIAGGITSAKFAAGAIDANAMATDAIGSAELSGQAVDKIAQAIVTGGPLIAARLDVAVSTRAAPGAAMTVGALGTDVVNAAALAADAVAEIAAAIVTGGPIIAARIDAAISSRAAPGALMGIVAGGITAAKFASDAVDANAIAASAANKIAAAAVANGPIDAAKLDVAVSTRAAPGATMALVDGAITDPKIADGAISGNKLAASAADKVRDAILSDSTPFPGAHIDVAISTRAKPGDAMSSVVDDGSEGNPFPPA